MKILQKRVQVLYRFRCKRCRSKFEMTEEEKRENDIKFTDDWADRLKKEELYGSKASPHNPLNWFDCPVCGTKRSVRNTDMHKFSVMDDGTEIQDY